MNEFKTILTQEFLINKDFCYKYKNTNTSETYIGKFISVTPRGSNNNGYNDLEFEKKHLYTEEAYNLNNTHLFKIVDCQPQTYTIKQLLNAKVSTIGKVFILNGTNLGTLRMIKEDKENKKINAGFSLGQRISLSNDDEQQSFEEVQSGGFRRRKQSKSKRRRRQNKSKRKRRRTHRNKY